MNIVKVSKYLQLGACASIVFIGGYMITALVILALFFVILNLVN